jgi:predicted nuclease with TOPRIM domain
MKNVERITGEITKTRDKIAELQNRLKELERQKTEAENFNIVALVRGMELEPDKLRAFIEAYHTETNNNAANAVITAAAGKEKQQHED